MLSKYSSSPALHLKIDKSVIGALLWRIYVFVFVSSVVSLALQGQATIAFVLGGLVASVMALEAREYSGRDRARQSIVLLRWAAGRWTLDVDGRCQTIQPTKRCITFPWFVYFSYTLEDEPFELLAAGAAEKRPHRAIWLFVDSAPSQQQRQLRVRLRMEGLV